MEYKFTKCKLEDIGEIVGGGTPSTKKKEYYGGNISWITPKDLSNNQSKYIFEGSRNITKEGLDNSSAKLLPKGSVLFSSRAPIGYVAIAGKEVATNQGFKSIIPNNNTSSDFLYYLLINNTNNIKNQGSGSTFNEVSGSVMKNIEVLIPSIKIQNKIASILSNLDKKIEINNKIISNLEEQAQAIFKSWFVDFEPFQNGEFVKSELGLIPKEWEIKPIGELFDFDIGGGWGKEKPSDKNIFPAYVIRGTDIPKSRYGYINKDNYRYHTESNLKRRILQIGDIIFESSGGSTNQILGRMLYISKNILEAYNYNAICASFCKLIRIDNPLIRIFVYNLLEYSYLNKLLIKYEVQSTGIANFSFSIFKNDFKIVLPNKDILEKFYSICNPILESISNLGGQNQRLSKVRDTLLPKLMSGEIDVSNIKIDEEENE